MCYPFSLRNFFYYYYFGVGEKCDHYIPWQVLRRSLWIFSRFPQTCIIYSRYPGQNWTPSLATFRTIASSIIEVAALNTQRRKNNEKPISGFKREGSMIHYAVESGVVQLLNITQDRQKCHQINLKSALHYEWGPGVSH